MVKEILVTASLLGSGHLFGSSWQSFCEGVPDWPKGSEVPAASKYAGVAKVVDGAFTKSKWDKMKGKDFSEGKWVIIDARSKPDRSVGKVPKSVMLTADYKNASKNEIKEALVVKKVNKRLKSSYKSLADMTDVNYILFCNGKKCHRSSFGACELRKLGVPENKLFLMLGGFPEWKDRGYPTR